MTKFSKPLMSVGEIKETIVRRFHSTSTTVKAAIGPVFVRLRDFLSKSVAGTTRLYQRLEWLIFPILGVLLFFGVIYRAPTFAEVGLDPSWKLALQYAALTNMQFGTDFSFTGGPFSFIYSTLFSPQTWAISLFAYGLQAAILTVAIYGTEARLRVLLLMQALFIIVLPFDRDALLFATTFAAFLAASNERLPFWLRLAATASMGLFGLAKFSFFLCSVCLFGLIDVSRLIDARRWPLFLPVFILSAWLIFTVAAQNPLHFPAYVLNSIDVAIGYAKAMPNYGYSLRPVMLSIIFTASTGVVAYFAFAKGFNVKRGALVLGYAGFMFLVFKSAAVREGHDVIGWQTLPVVLALTLPFAGFTMPRRSTGPVLTAVVLLVAAPFYIPPYIGGAVVNGWWASRSAIMIQQYYALDALFRAPALVPHYENTRQARLETLAQLAPRGLEQRVGAVPWEFSSLIAAGYDFVPQPSLQGYASYTPALRAADSTFFASGARPDSLVFGLSTIDHRLPGLDLGRSATEIMASYDFIGRFGQSAVLRSRETRRSFDRTSLSFVRAGLGEWVDVPAIRTGYIEASIDTDYTLGGRAQGFILKHAHLWIDVRYANGQEQEFRYVPTMGETGFLLLPSEPDVSDLFGPDSLAPVRGERDVVSIRLRAMDWPFDNAIADEIEVDFNRLAFGGELNSYAGETLVYELQTGTLETSYASHMIEQGLLVHADSRIRVETEGGRPMRGTFGFRPEVFDHGMPGPMTFSITRVNANGANETLFSRRLTPETTAPDRLAQPFAIDLPSTEDETPLTLLFEIIADDGNNAWGWTYWGNPVYEPDEG